ncbi:MAG TPA: undecaprenyl diphosphate synthase family protein [Methanosarcina sp.]|nr:undecaprenyl diphosphate synthase family protein [Methanosarcina sp.]
MDLLSFGHPLYEKYLTWQITRSSAKIPKHVALILKETDLLEHKGIEKLLTALLIFRRLKVELVSIYVDIIKADKQVNAELVSTLGERLEESFIHLPSETGYEIYGLEGEVKNSRQGKDFFVYVSLGFGGRREITRAVISLLEEVKAGRIRPEEVDEKMLESHLLVKHEPDIMIRSGGQKLSDFLVWQSVYSELFFTDVNWKDIRKIDLLRVIRDFQKRQRRYGK